MWRGFFFEKRRCLFLLVSHRGEPFHARHGVGRVTLLPYPPLTRVSRLGSPPDDSVNRIAWAMLWAKRPKFVVAFTLDRW